MCGWGSTEANQQQCRVHPAYEPANKKNTCPYKSVKNALWQRTLGQASPERVHLSTETLQECTLALWHSATCPNTGVYAWFHFRVQDSFFAVLTNRYSRTHCCGWVSTGRLFQAGGSQYATLNTCPAVLAEYRTPYLWWRLSEKGKEALVKLHVEGIMQYIWEFKRWILNKNRVKRKCTHYCLNKK